MRPPNLTLHKKNTMSFANLHTDVTFFTYFNYVFTNTRSNMLFTGIIPTYTIFRPMNVLLFMSEINHLPTIFISSFTSKASFFLMSFSDPSSNYSSHIAQSLWKYSYRPNTIQSISKSHSLPIFVPIRWNICYNHTNLNLPTNILELTKTKSTIDQCHKSLVRIASSSLPPPLILLHYNTYTFQPYIPCFSHMKQIKFIITSLQFFLLYIPLTIMYPDDSYIFAKKSNVLNGITCMHYHF